MLKIQNLRAGYDGMEILKGIDFETKPAEIVAIIGPNGAGKSTLLKSIFNLAKIYSGKIIFKNKNITRFPTYQLIQEGVAYVPQGRQVFGNLTVQENLEMGAFTINPKAKSQMSKLFEKIYNFFPFLQEKEKELASNLSGGQQQMLAIGRALVQTPELLLLDEPSLGLAPKITKQVFEKVLQVQKEGIAIIIVEQNAKQAVSIADRTYVLEDGRIVMQGGKEILENEKIKSIYFGGR